MSIVIDRNLGAEFGLQCVLCRHRYAGYQAGCAAFPDGIPRPIAADEFDHHYAYPGDHGIQFEPMAEPAAVGKKQAA